MKSQKQERKEDTYFLGCSSPVFSAQETIIEKKLLLTISLICVIRQFSSNLESFSQSVCGAKCEIVKGATSQTLQGPVSMLKVKGHDSAIINRLNKYGLFGRVMRRKALLFEQTTRLLEQ